MKITVVDPRLITFSGPTLVPVKKLATLKANTEQAGKAKLVAALTCKHLFALSTVAVAVVYEMSH